MNMSLSKLQEVVKDREAWHAVVQGIAKSWQMTEQMNNNHSMKAEDLYLCPLHVSIIYLSIYLSIYL